MRLSLGARTACRTARPRARQGPGAPDARVFERQGSSGETRALRGGRHPRERVRRVVGRGDDPRQRRRGRNRRGLRSPRIRRGARRPKVSAARCARGRIAGDGACRCRLCEGDHERNRMVVRACPSNHPPLRAVRGQPWASRRARSCPICKEPFDGWHYGERDDATGAWTRRFQAPLPRHPESAAKGLGGGRNGKGNRDGNGTGRHRARARSARALTFNAADLAARSPEPRSARERRERERRRRRRDARIKTHSGAFAVAFAFADAVARGGGGTPPRDARGRRERRGGRRYADDGMENDAGGVRTRDAVQRKRHSDRSTFTREGRREVR